VNIPVILNGDVKTPQDVKRAFDTTGADAVMIGRAAQGRPWIFREIGHFLATGTELAPPLVAEVRRLLLEHLQDHYALYGEFTGVRSARKHIGWYVRGLPGADGFRERMNRIEDAQAQWRAVDEYFEALGARMDRMPAVAPARAGQEEQEMLEAGS
jgi:tRNA-dihydrouridine synthase B